MTQVMLIDIPGLDKSHLERLPALKCLGDAQTLNAQFPLVTCPVQSSILTGLPPAKHGVVANGLMLPEMHKPMFWEQSAKLVSGETVFAAAKKNDEQSTGAMLFWQNSIGSDADIVITPAPIHLHDRLALSCYTQPSSLDAWLTSEMGQPFPLHKYWGPLASFDCVPWIASSARHVWEEHSPSLLVVYLPVLDYSLQRFGLGSHEVNADLDKLNVVLADLISMAHEDNASVVCLSEYGMHNSTRAVDINIALREAGLLKVRPVEDFELLDYTQSDAWALVDHQCAYIYCKEEATEKAKEVVSKLDGVDVVDTAAAFNLDHPRTGTLVAKSMPDAWFTYYWWTNEDARPPFADKVDIHSKPGYDPLELFADPATRAISRDTSLICGTHGREDAPGIIIAPDTTAPLAVEDVKELLLSLLAK